MNARDVICQQAEFCAMLTQMYVSDLTDEQLLVRALPGTNHIAWQLGHMVVGTTQMLQALGHPAMELPDGFAAGYGKESAASDDLKQFKSKEEYLALLDRAKAAIREAVAATPVEQLDQPGPEAMRDYSPTVASTLLLAANHWLMHAGQFALIRRKLGKPPLF